MKNIFVLGIPRAGKSTFAKMLLRKLKGYSLIKLDALRDAFAETFPELEIIPNGKGMQEDFPKFVSKLVKWNGLLVKEEKTVIREEEVGLIIEGTHILPEHIETMFDKENSIIVFLGSGELTETEIFNNIRKYDTQKDYSYYRNDERVMNECKKSFIKNKKIMEQCEKYGYSYYDTSINREKVLENVFETIIKQLK